MPKICFKGNIDILAPFLVMLFNRSLAEGLVPTVFKEAYITPILKKADKDPVDVCQALTCKNHLSVKISTLLSVKAPRYKNSLTCKNLICKNCYVQKRTHTHGSLRADLAILWVNAIFRRPLNENLLTYRYEILHI
jgi:hypothetical protein